MSMRFQIFGIVVFFSLLTVVAYKMGQATQPPISYEAAYNAISKDDQVPAVKTKSATQKEMFSYVPAYSHVYISEGNPLTLAITLSLRNVDPDTTIHIKEIAYYNTKGNLIRKYLESGLDMGPLETKEIFIKRSDLEGGSGANFIVSYIVGSATRAPIFESVMSGELENHSYMFTSRGESYPR